MDFDLKHIPHSFFQQDKVDQVEVTKVEKILDLDIHKIFLSPVFFLLYLLGDLILIHLELRIYLDGDFFLGFGRLVKICYNINLL